MSLRPEPVTSKFRKYYLNDILPIYHNSKLSLSNCSSTGSTSSLTSILYRNNNTNNDDLNYDSFDDLSIENNELKIPDLPEQSFKRLNSQEFNYFTNKKFSKLKKQNGIFREIINSSENRNFNDLKNRFNKPSEKSCKRIIARKPDYPGSRITHVNYQETNCEQKNLKLKKSTNPLHKNGIYKAKGNPLENDKASVNEKSSSEKRIPRTIAKKNVNTRENSIKDISTKVVSEKSEVPYSVCDFTSVSEERINQSNKSDKQSIDDNNFSSIDDVNSISIDEAASVSNTDSVTDKQPPQRMLSPWNDWFLKKEKEDRKLSEEMRKKMLMAEAKKVEEEAAKEKRRELCQKKIADWLTKKEEERIKYLTKQKDEEKKKELKELEKDDLLKKSSKKYVSWKLKKMEQMKEKEKQEKEKQNKLDAEKMIKIAKSQTAFKHWLEEHKDHPLPVPYSYGISDGKLTSYYDKTSNPPPAFFNPKPWIPVIETKKLIIINNDLYLLIVIYALIIYRLI